MSEKIMRLGVFGTKRGCAYMKIFNEMPDVKITAICEKDPEGLERGRKYWNEDTKVFSDFEEFISSGLFDAVLMTNYFHEHAP